MQIENVIQTLKADFDCDESGLDWQEHKYQFDNISSNVYDINVNGITVPFVSGAFLNDNDLFLFGKGDSVLAEVPNSIIDTLEVIKK